MHFSGAVPIYSISSTRNCHIVVDLLCLSFIFVEFSMSLVYVHICMWVMKEIAKLKHCLSARWLVEWSESNSGLYLVIEESLMVWFRICCWSRAERCMRCTYRSSRQYTWLWCTSCCVKHNTQRTGYTVLWVRRRGSSWGDTELTSRILWWGVHLRCGLLFLLSLLRSCLMCYFCSSIFDFNIPRLLMCR